MVEIYKDIKGYEGKYQVSNLGNVKSLNYLNTNSPKVLTPVKHHGGYLFVHLGANKIRTVHTLVAEAFVDNPFSKKLVNHIDGDKHNNKASNLEWVTYKENSEHAIRTGLRNPHNNNHPSGKDTPNSRAILQYDKEGNLIQEWDCISTAAHYYGCNPCMIVNNAAGRSKSAKGYIWKYE